MSTIADEERTSGERGGWMVPVGAVIGIAILAVLGWMLVVKLIHGVEGPKRQTTKIAILPDTPPPPPPPPPPKEEPKKEPPKEVAAKPLQQDQPKPAPTPPANEPIKMEGAAGDGASPFAAGSVTRDATGGEKIGGASAPGGGGTSSDRARERFYANTARQLLRDEIERQLKPEAGELTASFALWVEPDGRIRRFELLPGGSPKSDSEMQAALDGTARELRLPPPEGLPQPLRFRLTVRSQS